MFRQVRSTASKPNPQLDRQTRKPAEDNLQWAARALASMGSADSPDWSYIALLGGNDTLAFRLRVAQSHLRRDMLPSYWSESVFVKLGRGADLARAKAQYVPLLQPDNGRHPTRSNGVVERPFKAFADARRWPNIALIALPVAQQLIADKVQSFAHAGGTIDALEHVLRWLGFAWGAARTPNPLLDGVGLPSACMLEMACAAAQFDLTPGLESRASCPEAIWVAALHWHQYIEQSSSGKRLPIGRYNTEHRYPIEEHDG